MSPPTTRERILDSAEELFADRGIGATTLRTLTRHADVNLAAVHYHFGSKEGLLDAVVERLATPINRDRHAALDRLEADGLPDASAVLAAFFTPVIERLEAYERVGRTATLARLLARIEAQPRDEVARLAERHFGEIARRTVDALTCALPGLDRRVVADRFLLATAVLNALFSDADTLALDDPPDPDCAAASLRGVAARAREALTFAEAGLRAPPARPSPSPCSPTTRQASISRFPPDDSHLEAPKS